MRIAINALSVAPGGSLTNTLGLLEGWSAVGRSDEVVVFASNPTILSHARQYDMTAVSVGAPGLIARAAWEVSVLPILLRRHKADVLLCSNYAVLSCSRPQVVQHQTLNTFLTSQLHAASEKHRRTLQRRAARMSMRLAAANIFISQHLRRHAEAVEPESGERNHVVPYGISARFLDVSRARPDRARPSFSIAALQSPAEYKDNESLLQAFRLLVCRRPDEPWQLRIAGQFDWSRWENRARDLGVFDRVRWEGFLDVEGVIRLLTSSDCLVYPSVLEAFGLPIIEGMACGCPVIAADVAASPEIAAGAAVLVPPASPQAIANAIERLHVDAAVRTEAVELGRRRARQFSWVDTAKHFDRIFERVIAERQVTPVRPSIAPF